MAPCPRLDDLRNEPDGRIPFTPNSKKVLEYGIEEARLLGHNYIGTEHLLLGLIKVKEGLAANVLNNLGVSLVKTRETILDLRSEAKGKTDPRSSVSKDFE